MIKEERLLFEKKDLRPYLLFAYKSLNPGGGLHDLRATFESKRDAFLYLIGMKNHPYCVHLVDIESLELRDDIDFYGYYQEWYSHYYIRKEQDDSKFETKIIEEFREEEIKIGEEECLCEMRTPHGAPRDYLYKGNCPIHKKSMSDQNL